MVKAKLPCSNQRTLLTTRCGKRLPVTENNHWREVSKIRASMNSGFGVMIQVTLVLTVAVPAGCRVWGFSCRTSFFFVSRV